MKTTTITGSIALAATLSTVLAGHGQQSGKPSERRSEARCQIVFASNRDAGDGNGGIYIMNPDGSGARRLTDDPADKFSPSCSPDGKRIAFVHETGESCHIRVMDRNGGNQTDVTPDLDVTGGLSWSPDGEQIAFPSRRDDQEDINIINADGSAVKKVASHAEEDSPIISTPCWSPDGKTIVFTSAQDGNPEIHTVNSDGTDQQRLTDNPAVDAWPCWCPALDSDGEGRQEDGQRAAREQARQEPHASKERPFVNSLGMEFVPVPGKAGVLMCRTETRAKDFRAYALAAGYRQQGGVWVCKVKKDGKGAPAVAWELDSSASWENCGFAQGAEHPVVGVSWEEARDFCHWLKRKEGLEYRLPSDGEWSAAAGIAKYPWGNSWPPPEGAGNYFGKEGPRDWPDDHWTTAYDRDDGYPHTAPVASFTENRNGFFDLGGNVWEWCEDRYQASMNDAERLEAYPMLKSEKADDGTPFRVLRGGSWNLGAADLLLSSCRFGGPPTIRHDFNGFRVVLVVSGS
ncbi:MAG: SUMF1/EgtB/PvdO family nonheme iron enzyme [Verrucomicrobia bacterium]|nr:SUMF1/EgtB/PvdO family nonheme iron enzyme [Verrucomicrobiota bacterium]